MNWINNSGRESRVLFQGLLHLQAFKLRITMVCIWTIVALQTGCVSTSVEVTPTVIGEDEVYVRGSGPPTVNGEIGIYEANGRIVARENAFEGSYLIRLPAGWNAISVGIDLKAAIDGRIEHWNVLLPGGKAYVVKGKVGHSTSLVWIEEESTGVRVTDEASVAMSSD